MDKNYIIFNIKFVNGNFRDVKKELSRGGLMVVPSGPGLITIGKDLRYTDAVQNADFAIPDSGFMVILIRILKGIKIKKLSGFEFLKFFFQEKHNKNDIFLIDPNEIDSLLNNKFLNDIGIITDKSNHYVAPIYSSGVISDDTLLKKLNKLKKKPKYILINLGSNVQEPLGYYLKKNLKFSSSIICTGAAISFFTGSQADLSIADKYYLGWLKRCIEKPSVFIPRYIKAFRLFPLILKSKIEVNK